LRQLPRRIARWKRKLNDPRKLTHRRAATRECDGRTTNEREHERAGRGSMHRTHARMRSVSRVADDEVRRQRHQQYDKRRTTQKPPEPPAAHTRNGSPDARPRRASTVVMVAVLQGVSVWGFHRFIHHAQHLGATRREEAPQE
jgi:hypothetical protein